MLLPIFKMPFLIPNSGSAKFIERDNIHQAAAVLGMTARLMTVRLVTVEKQKEASLCGAAPANLNSATCACQTPSCAVPEPASSSAAVLPLPAPAPCSPGPGCCPPADASPLKHKQAERARLLSSRTPPPGPRPMKDSTSHL